MRRSVACVLALSVALSAAGCLGGDSEPVHANGSPATLRSDAVADAGYERAGTTNRTLNATLTTTVEGDIEAQASQDVMATIPVSLYRRPGDSPSVVAVASSPVVQILENPPRSSDPLSTLSTAELVAFVQTTYGDVGDVERVDDANRTVTALGEETTLVTYRGTATASGTALDVRVRVVRVRDDRDAVTVVAVRPASTDRSADLPSLLDALEH